MTIRLTIFGIEVFCLSLLTTTPEVADEDDEEEESTITGGPTHNFERDTSPLSPDDRYDWGEWKFGFRKP